MFKEGDALLKRCPACSSENVDDRRFCGECGYNLIDGLTGSLAPTSNLENRYHIIKTIGRGGMGAVYLAQDQRLNNTPVAVKEMSTNAVGQGCLQAAISAFKKEAAILIGLRHPALPRVIDFFSLGFDRWYLVMDFIEGISLSKALEAHGRFDESPVLDWAGQLCEILHFLHTQEPPIIFRDLKPSNIMLTPQGQIKLVDFGIARHFRPEAGSDTAAYGSSGFAPPEQYGDRQTSVRSDIYALGATLHYLLTGVNPKHRPFIFDSPDQFVPISPRLNAAIISALEPKPENRPETVAQFWEMATGQSWSQHRAPYNRESAGQSHNRSDQDLTATLVINAVHQAGQQQLPSSGVDINRPVPIHNENDKSRYRFWAVGLTVLIGLCLISFLVIYQKNNSSFMPIDAASSSAVSVEQASPREEAADKAAVSSSETQPGSVENPAMPVKAPANSGSSPSTGTTQKVSTLSSGNSSSGSTTTGSQAAQAESYDARPTGESYDFRSSGN